MKNEQKKQEKKKKTYPQTEATTQTTHAQAHHSPTANHSAGSYNATQHKAPSSAAKTPRTQGGTRRAYRVRLRTARIGYPFVFELVSLG